MIASFFQHLDDARVRWLLVSGQATILYGAATFSEDVDLWVEPSNENLGRFTSALRASSARYYKLTPPLIEKHARQHHGFHFTLPGEGDTVEYLDVMGSPPRVEQFDEAYARSRTFQTAWGPLPTVGVEDLVELKKTQRPRDYPIISRLVLARLRELGAAVTRAKLAWALENVFTLSEFRALATLCPGIVDLDAPASIAARAAHRLLTTGDFGPDLEDELEAWFDARMTPLRRADRHFWRSVIDELRRLRASDELVPEGRLV